jgi:hypothetical protein
MEVIASLFEFQVLVLARPEKASQSICGRVGDTVACCFRAGVYG